MQQAIIIYGPTAVGKSSIAVELAKMIDGEIISADSMQIYKKLNIGTAKISHSEMQSIPHHLIDVKMPTEDYSVSEFCQQAEILITQICSRNKVPIIVGGTGLYINSLINGYTFSCAPKNQDFRDELSSLSNEQIYSMLLKYNPSIQIDFNNRQRLIRALEMCKFGKQCSNKKSSTNYLLFAILDDRQAIYNRINSRVDKMIDSGLLDEAKYLLSLNLPETNLAVKAIGYKELFPYLKGECSLQECVDVLKQKTRNYAKRQITFLNQFNSAIKINFSGVQNTANIIKQIIEEKKTNE